MFKKDRGDKKFRKDGVYYFENTHHLIPVALENGKKLCEMQNNNPKNNPYTNMHELIERFDFLQKEQNFLGK